MPAARPRASFEPIPPDFDVRTFVETADNFQYADRISHEMIANNGMEQFEKLVLLHVIIGGKPLVIDGFEEVLDPWTFTPAWLRDNYGEKEESARNLTDKSFLPLTVKHYLKNMSKLTEQFFASDERYRDKTRQRVYLKDIDCPPVWQSKLKEHIPSGLFYLNDSTGEVGGAGAVHHPGQRKARGIGRAGDLMSSLPPEMRAENLMCYIGHEGTYTPAHREMCASLGQNIMVDASKTVGEEGKPERPGSSLWFMTETKDRHLVSEYWLSILGHDIEVENHFAQLIAWKKAPFKTYVVEQRPGDFILIPPLAPHQVWNRGTRTMKIAWNRTTVETLEMALSEALPNSRVVCRDEQYKNKAIVYYTLMKYSALIKSARAQVEMGGEQAEAIQRSLKVRHVQRDFKRLFDLFKIILLSEMFAPEAQQPREYPEYLPFDGNVTCAYCRCNIFNRFLTCKSCKNLYSQDIDEPYDVCMDCYCMGRSCGCQSGYTWVEQWKWKDLVHKYEEWRAQIIDIDGQITGKTPLPLQEERLYLSKKTLAQVCQEQHKIRPFIDIKNPTPLNEESEEEEPNIDEYGRPKPAKKKSKQWLNKHKSCHVCLHRHPKWKMAFCTNCDYAYCYGTLFRAHDLMPLTVMENATWKCPHCSRVCNTGKCRSDPRQISYEPKGTLLGHDTKKVADPRSVECLVDFSVSNLNWLREEEVAMANRRADAERAKLANPEFDDRYMDLDHDGSRNGIAYSPVDENGGFDNQMAESNGAIDPHAMDDTWMGAEISYFPDQTLDSEIPRLGKRNRDDQSEPEGTARRNKKNKKRKNQDETPRRLEPKSTSGKEFQKEVDRKRLEQAKREDRYIIVAARMKGKSKIVKLVLDSNLLEAIQNRVPEHTTAAREREPNEVPAGIDHSILQSDIMQRRKSTIDPAQKEKASKTFRVRIDEDEAYSTRKRDPERMQPSKSGKVGRPGHRRRRFEDVTIDSEEEENEGNEDYLTAGQKSSAHRSRGRASNWLARKNEGEENLPTELPADFRDGAVNAKRERNRECTREYRERQQQEAERRKSMPAQVDQESENKEPPSDDAGVYEGDSHPDEAVDLAQEAAAALDAQRDNNEEAAQATAAEERRLVAEKEAQAKLAAEKEAEARQAAEEEAQENLRAKMDIEEELDGYDNESLNGFIDTLAAEDEPLAHERDEVPSPQAEVRTAPLQTTNSLFLQPGMQGKRKIRITAKTSGDVSSNTQAATTTISVPVVGFTSVNQKASKTVNVSDSGSDGEDEIPAKAPISCAKKPVGRPRGRPSLKPSRGGSSGRGRGRPRGRPRKSL